MQGAWVLTQRLETELPGGLASLKGLICSVPPQHMFGLEASVMLALVHGLPCLDERPLLPEDVRCAFASDAVGDGHWIWITTPLHLRALSRADISIPHCGLALASTMPLAPGIAAHAETLLGAPVLEIYGSTETGALALRRSARETLWRALPGVTLSPMPQGTQVRGLHFTSPQTLADSIELHGEDRFHLLGRHADMIKVAGRRASLAGLNLLLQDLPGLDDGVFYLPNSGELDERLVLIYAGAPLDHANTMAWLRDRLDPAFLPRAFIHVDALPRSGPGKLGRAALDALYVQWLARRKMS
jgi:acyl-coenzyme A synthetase/AMP-(fatty) acid ligase